MSFPMQILQGYRHAVLGFTDDQATLVVFVETGGIESLARQLIRRCPGAQLPVCSDTRAVLQHASFRAEMTPCTIGPQAVLLDVRRPTNEIGDAILGASRAVGDYVSAVTGSALLGVAASFGALKAIDHLATSLKPATNGNRMRGRGRS